MKCHRRERNRAVGTGEACQAGSEILSQPREGGFAINRELLMSCVIVAMMIISMATVQASVQEVNPTTVDMAVYDLFGEPYRPGGDPWGAHEGIPHGVPSDYAWYAGACGFSSYGENQAITTWGHVYEWAEGSPFNYHWWSRSIPVRPYPKTRRLFIHPWRY